MCKHLFYRINRYDLKTGFNMIRDIGQITLVRLGYEYQFDPTAMRR